MSVASIEQLRELIAFKQGFSQKEHFATSLLSGGIPKGAITQIFGYGKTEATVQFLRDNPEQRVAWIEVDFELNPVGILQRDVNLTRILFTEAGEHLMWAALQALKSQLFSIVVLRTKSLHEKDLRKLQLAAEKANSSVILLSEEFSPSWPISLVVKPHPCRNGTDQKILELEVLRQR